MDHFSTQLYLFIFCSFVAFANYVINYFLSITTTFICYSPGYCWFFFFNSLFKLCEFFLPVLTVGLLPESEWQQVFSGIEGSFEYPSHNNAVVLMVSIFLLVSNFTSLLSKPLRTVPSATSYNWCQRHHVPQFLSSQARSKYSSVFTLSLISTQWFAGQQNSRDD